MSQSNYSKCSKCQKVAWFSLPIGMGYQKICDVCEREDREQKEKTYLVELEKLPIDKRIERIERWIYRHKKGRS